MDATSESSQRRQQPVCSVCTERTVSMSLRHFFEMRLPLYNRTSRTVNDIRAILTIGGKLCSQDSCAILDADSCDTAGILHDFDSIVHHP